jgi:hypothetical protein
MLPGLLGIACASPSAPCSNFAASVSRRVSPRLFSILIIVEANPGLKQSQLPPPRTSTAPACAGARQARGARP